MENDISKEEKSMLKAIADDTTPHTVILRTNDILAVVFAIEFAMLSDDILKYSPALEPMIAIRDVLLDHIEERHRQWVNANYHKVSMDEALQEQPHGNTDNG